MLRFFVILALTLISAPASAGIRAIYDGPLRAPMVIEIADNGDINADITENWHFVVRANHAFLIQERLTGPLVMRSEDLAALLPPANAQSLAPTSDSGLVQRGVAEVNGRVGQAYFYTHASGTDAQTPEAVISSDPALGALGAAMRRLLAAEDLVGELDWGWPPAQARDNPLDALLEHGAALRFGDLTLRSFEQVPIDEARFTLPADPESAEAIRRRRAAEARGDQNPQSRNRMISRAVFGAGRLWLLTAQGQLSSLAEGERTRRLHDLGEKVLDICVRGNVPVALTGERGEGESWTIQHWQGGAWRTFRTIARTFDSLIALACDRDQEMALTSRRLIDLTGRARAVTLSEPLYPALVRTVVHVTPEAAWVGMNRGEWGGGLRRIDRVTGIVATIARNATDDSCGGPLSTNCDPVNGLATIPWRPQCVAAAIGLIHFEAHGRITAVCPDGIAQLFAAPDAVDPGNTHEVAEAAGGGYGAVAFFGLVATDDALIAAGHNGLYRIDANGTGTRRPWPRFTEIDGILVSFALPDVVLVMSELNRRASVSGIAPLMAVR